MDVDKLPATLRSREHFISWGDLPKRLRARTEEYEYWHPDYGYLHRYECRFWEDVVDLKEVHSGGDPLVEIFDFIAKWDLYILRAYFGPSWKWAGAYFHAQSEEVGTILGVSTSDVKKYQLSGFRPRFE